MPAPASAMVLFFMRSTPSMGWPRASWIHRRRRSCAGPLVGVGTCCELVRLPVGPVHRGRGSGLLVERALGAFPGRRHGTTTGVGARGTARITSWVLSRFAGPAGGGGDAQALAPGVVA